MTLARLLPFAMIAGLTTTALAAEIKTSLGDQEPPDTGNKVSELAFVWSGCEEECHVASLTCNSYRSIGYTAADVDAKDVAKAITGKQQVVLTVGGKPFVFSIYKLDFMEMTGSWWMDARLEADPFELLAELSKAKTFTTAHPGKTLKLPVTADLLTWAKACRGND